MNKGFTIVETLVAIAVLVAAVIGATSAVQTALSSYILSKNQITAFYLAQEGFEKIRNLRDENVINHRNWLYGIAAASGDPCYFGSACTVSPIEVVGATQCTAPGSCPLLREDPTTGLFGYNSAWPATTFRREISIVSVNANEVALTVTMTWSKGGSIQTFKVRENLLNWQ